MCSRWKHLWTDGRTNVPSLRVVFSDYCDELFNNNNNNNNNNNEIKNINTEDVNEFPPNTFTNKHVILNKPVLIKNICAD